MAGPDGDVWFTETGTPDRIGRLSPSGRLTEFPLSTNESVSDLVAGPDGNIWFIQSSGPEIGRITKSGSLTEFPLPSTGFQPSGIAAGPDGNIWIAGSDEVVRITPAGTATVFVAPPPPAAVNQVGFGMTAPIAGPGGDSWFGTSIGYLGRMTTSGVVSYIPLPTTAPFGTYNIVSAMTAGRDGDLWFLADTAQHAEVVGHVAPDGTVTAFPKTTDANLQSMMTVGPDGNLWITQPSNFYMAAYVERFTPTGAGSFRSFTTQPHPNDWRDVPLMSVGLTTGPDGNLWITEVPGVHGPGISGPYEVVQLVVTPSTPDGTRNGHKARRPKSTRHLRAKPEQPTKGHESGGAFGPR